MLSRANFVLGGQTRRSEQPPPAHRELLMKRRRGSVVLAVVAMVAAQLVLPAGGAGADPGHGRPCVRTLSTGLQTVEVSFAGQVYPVRVNVPPSAVPAERLPMVLNLHYSNGNADQQ